LNQDVASPEMISEPVGPARRVYRNLLPLLGGKAAAGVISLVYMIIAARVLGPRNYGVLVLIHGFVLAVDGWINFPGWQAVVRYGALPLAEGRMTYFLRLLRFTTAIELVFGIVAVTVAAVSLPYFARHLGWPPEAQAFALPYGLAALAAVRSTPCGYLQIIRRFDLLGIHSAITPLIRLIGALIALFFDLGLTGFLVAWLCAALVEWLLPWAMMSVLLSRRTTGESLWGWPTDMRRETPGIGRFMFVVNADSTFSDVANRMVPLIVGAFLGPEAAAYLAIAQRATTIISQPGLMLGQAAYVELAQLAAHHDTGPRIRHALIRVIGIALLTALPVVLGLMLFAGPVVRLLAGPAYLAAAVPLVWLAAARAILIIIPPTNSAMVAMGYPGWSVLCNVVSGIGLLPLLLAMLAYWGLAGAGAFLLAQAVVNALMLVGLAWRVTSPAFRRSS